MEHIINTINTVLFIFCASCLTMLLEYLNPGGLYGLNAGIMFSLWFAILPATMFVFYFQPFADKATLVMLVMLYICISNVVELFHPFPIKDKLDFLIHGLPLVLCGIVWQFRTKLYSMIV